MRLSPASALRALARLERFLPVATPALAALVVGPSNRKYFRFARIESKKLFVSQQSKRKHRSLRASRTEKFVRFALPAPHAHASLRAPVGQSVSW